MDIAKLISQIFGFQNNIKITHWVTNKYSYHKASDEFLTNLSSKFDKLIESLLGLTDERIFFKTQEKIPLIYIEHSSISFFVEEFKNTLLYMPKVNTEIDNLLQEIFIEIDQFLYLIKLN
jgi:hypothetical protein